MGSSVTGQGLGAAGKFTTTELSILANAPSIIFSGITETTGLMSPPVSTNNVVFPYPLPGGMDKYVVLLTTINGGVVYVSDRDEDDDGNFTGFSFVSESDGDVMYLVAKVGVRPQL
jgi:hypothetical protein